MRQAIHQHLIATYAIPLGLMTVLMSLLPPIPSASAQQLIGTVIHETGKAGTQERRIENIAPTRPYPIKSLEKKGTQTSPRKLHRLIRKPQNAPVAAVEPSPSSSFPTSPLAPQSNNTTSQSKEPSSLNRSVGVSMPPTTTSVAPSSVRAMGSIIAGTAPTGTIPLAAAGAGNSSTSGSGRAGGRSMSRLAAEMPGLAQLISPPSAPAAAPTITLNVTPASLAFTATQGAANPANQSLTITSNTAWTVSKNASWLTVTPTSGSNNGTPAVSVNTATATVGSNSGTITITGGGLTRAITVNLTLNAPATTSATLQWNASGESDLAGYKVYRANSSSAYASGPIATLPANVTSYQAIGLQVGTGYFFVITAYDSAGNESQYSNEVSMSAQ